MRASLALVTAAAIAFGLGGPASAGGTVLAKGRPGADLAVSIADAPDPVGVGKTVAYTVTVRNGGPSRANGVTATTVLPAGMEFVSATGRSCASNASRIVCKLGSIRKGSKVVLKIETKATTTGSLSASATVSTKTADPRRRNNSATQTTKVLGLDTVQGNGVRPVFGPAVTLGFRVSIDIDAVSAFNGEDAAGTFATRYPNGDPDIRGHVVCLSVSGNRAMVGGIIDSATGSNPGATPPGSGVLLAVTDNGEPGAGRDTEISYLGVENARSCALQDNAQEIALTDGNFTVHDEQP